MAAKKNDPRREARIAKNNRNLNSALTLFTAGFIAEFYLLLINQYFVKGSVDQVVAIAGYLEVMAIVGAAAFGAGVVLTVMRGKWTRFAALGRWLLSLGLFFGVSSLLMRRVYPMGTTVMCILVPVLMLLAVVFLLYQHEFAVQAIALTLAIAMSAKYLRQVRATVLDELSKDYVLGARARGVKFSTTMIKSVMKASLVTIITLLTLSIGSLLGGTAIVESIFMWDGVGKLAVDAINMRDYPIIQAYVMWMAIIYVVVNLITDLSYHFLDPRIRLGGIER